ncbi:MAG: hypothetical protein AAB396_01960 [Patescibacteria group bacterium]|mgnify:FL=1
MIIFLYGPDSYCRRKKLNEILDQYKKKHMALNIGKFDFAENNGDDEFLRLQEFSLADSLFESEKLAVIEDIFEWVSKENQKKTAEFLKLNLEDKKTTFIILSNKAPIKTFDFLLKKPSLAQEFENFKDDKLEFFIKKKSEERGINLEPRAILFLADVFIGDSWGLINELDKFSLLDKKSFSADDLKKIIDYYKPISSSDFFIKIKNFSFSRSLAQKLENLEFLLENEDPAKIFNFLSSFSSNQPALIKKFADYDVAVKSGKMEYEEILLDLALNA